MTDGPTTRRRPRRGAALVETAFVLVAFLMLLFGVFEYCRMIFTRQLLANAAREGARYAVVNTTSATLDADTRAFVQQKMAGFEGKVQNFSVQIYHGDASGNKVYGYDAAGNSAYGYQTDGTGKYLTDASNGKYYISADTTGNYVLNGATKVYVNLNATTGEVSGVNASAWNSFTSGKQIQGVDPATNAAFGQYIVVQVDCDYQPILPSFLRLGNTIHMQVKGLMYSEAN